MHETPTMDDFCHLYRDVRVGASGGDAHCLQRWLAKAGHLSSATSPSGTFDDATSLAVAKWQKANKWNASGTIDEATRKAYGERYGFATSASGRLIDDRANGSNPKGLACVDVCAEFGEAQFCQTKCARDGDAAPFACRAACQDAFTGACDRAFPPTSEDNREKFATCLSHTPRECALACARI